jgi:RNA polymerase sigma-70 factor (ECF subfamily)
MMVSRLGDEHVMQEAAGATPDEAARAHGRVTGGEGPLEFRAFYAEHLRDVTGLAYTLTGSWHAAEDVAQEAFVRAYRAWSRIAAYERPDSWVRTVAANLAASRGRRLAAEARALMRLRSRRTDIAPDPLPEDADSFWAAVRRLPRRQGEAVALRYYSDFSVTQIAEAMRCAEGTVKAHLHSARQHLADALRPEGGTPR